MNNKIYNVTFKENGKSIPFFSEEEYQINDKVIVETEKNNQYGKIVGITNNIPEEKNKIVRLATEEDYEKYLKNLSDADKALKKCHEFVKELDLKMKVINAQYSFDRNQLQFNFIADDRIDFRELAKKLASIYHTRIELRQIGARDKAKEIGGIGICGKKLCCSNFLNQIESVSMNMAKNQNLALNPSKINGCCGRLLCCLCYEDQQYQECAKDLPKIGETIKTKKGQGIVDSLDILNRSYRVIINGEKEEFYLDENNKK